MFATFVIGLPGLAACMLRVPEAADCYVWEMALCSFAYVFCCLGRLEDLIDDLLESSQRYDDVACRLAPSIGASFVCDALVTSRLGIPRTLVVLLAGVLLAMPEHKHSLVR